MLSAIGTRHFNVAPNVESMTVEFDGSADIGRARLIGAAGAVQPCDAVFVGNLELGDFVNVYADADGAFEAVVDSVAGTLLLVGRHPRWGTPWGIHAAEGPASVLVRIPVEQGSDGVAFSSAMRIQHLDDFAWVIEGTLGSNALMPDQEVPISGRVILTLPSETRPPAAELRFGVFMIGDGSRPVKWCKSTSSC